MGVVSRTCSRAGARKTGIVGGHDAGFDGGGGVHRRPSCTCVDSLKLDTAELLIATSMRTYTTGVVIHQGIIATDELTVANYVDLAIDLTAIFSHK